MNTQETEHIKLIHGSFTAAEAKEILLTALDFKINFHNIRNLRSIECNGKPDERSITRIEELKAERQRFLRIITAMEKNGQSLKIRGGFDLVAQKPEAMPA